MVSIKFNKPWFAYSPGDIAGFDEGRANALIKCGAAELYQASAANAPDAPAGDENPAGDQPAEVATPPARSRSK